MRELVDAQISTLPSPTPATTTAVAVSAVAAQGLAAPAAIMVGDTPAVQHQDFYDTTRMMEHNRMVAVRTDQIPTFTQPTESCQNLMYKMWWGINTHNNHQALLRREIPITFHEAGIHVDLGRQMLGEENWKAIFPTAPTDQSVIPRRVLTLFECALGKYPELVTAAMEMDAIKTAVDQRMRKAASERGYQA